MTDLDVKSALSKEGWNLSDDGYAACSSACADNKVSPASLHEAALNQDLRKIGTQYLPNSIVRGVTQEVKAPLILQIQKVTNIAVPSYHQHDGSEGGIRLLKLQVTDGHIYCNALELKHTPQLNSSMPPGTKLKITSDVIARNGFLLLTPSVVKVLGGHVDHMVEKWKASKVVMERSKAIGIVGDGPPAFVPFSEATRKNHFTAKPTVESRKSNVTQSPLKHNNQPKQDAKISAKQTDKPKAHQHQLDRSYDTTPHRQSGNKPHQHHQAKPSHQCERFQDRSFQGEFSKQRTHNSHHKQSRGHFNDRSGRSQGQSFSDHLPVTFDSSEEHFPALSHPASHPRPPSTAADDRPPHRPRDSQTSSSTGGGIPFSAKRKT